MRGMYGSYALNGHKTPPSLDGFDFVNVGKRKELSDILKEKLREEDLPPEIRVIRPHPEKDIWGIFFKP